MAYVASCTPAMHCCICPATAQPAAAACDLQPGWLGTTDLLADQLHLGEQEPYMQAACCYRNRYYKAMIWHMPYLTTAYALATRFINEDWSKAAVIK